MAQRGRKPIYTPEEAKQKQVDRIATWNKERSTTVNLRMVHMDKARYNAYAEAMQLPVATMFRACVERCMQLDGWTWEPTAEELHELEQEAEERRKRASGEGEE